MWKLLYDKLLQWLTSIPWAEFLKKHGAIGRTFRDRVYQDMYSYAGIYLLLISVISCIIYYYYLNSRFGNYYSNKSWCWWMFINSFLIALTTFITGKVIFGSFICPTTTHVIWLSIINFVYGLLLFFIISILVKWKSPMAKRTPF